MAKKLQISIVVPVYNEAEHLDACLQAIAQQTVHPFEVIVVDNNSDDDTAAVALRYGFVTLLREPKQGVVHARDRGFNAAKGEIIARIDADTILDPDWLAQLNVIFQDSSVAAVSGSVGYYDLPWRRATTRLELGFRQWIANGMAGEVFLQGANMAIRRNSWHTVRAQLCNTRGLHEDFDLAIHLHDANERVEFMPQLHANLSLRRFDSSFADFLPYALQNPRTYAVHGRISQRYMYPAIALVLIGFYPIKLLYRAYDADTDSFSVSKLFSMAVPGRVNPANFVD